MRISLHVLGYPEVKIADRTSELRLRKGIALLVYLAVAGTAVARERLCGLFWPDATDAAAKASLRRTLHRARAAFGEDVFQADGESVRVNPEITLQLDAADFEEAIYSGSFDQAFALYRGEFLAGFALADCPDFEEWVFFEREALRQHYVHALERLTEREAGRNDYREALSYAKRLLAVDPLDETAHRRVIQLHLMFGDRAAAKKQLNACATVLEQELGIVPGEATTSMVREPPSAATAPPKTLYAKSGNVHIAFQCIGDGPIDIVLCPGYISHVERAWEQPRCRAWIAEVTTFARVIFFDRRGVGLSDRVGAQPTVEATAEDIAAVMDAVGSKQAVLLGASEGGPACIQFAAAFPHKVIALLLWGAVAKGSRTGDYPYALRSEHYDLWLERLVREWGGPAELETFAPSLINDHQAEHWWAGLLRSASSPGAIRGVLYALRDTDVRSLLPRISVPTIVFQRTGDRVARREAGQYLAQHIPRARLVELPGDDHWFWVGDQLPLINELRQIASAFEPPHQSRHH